MKENLIEIDQNILCFPYNSTTKKIYKSCKELRLTNKS